MSKIVFQRFEKNGFKISLKIKTKSQVQALLKAIKKKISRVVNLHYKL